MKSMFKKISLLSLFAFIAVLLIGCSSNDPLANLSTTMSNVVTSTSNIDDVSSEDLSEENVTVLSFEFDNTLTLLSFEPGLSNLEKLALIRDMHLSIVSHQMLINSTRDEILVTLESIKTIITELRENEVTLSDEDKLTVENWIERLKEIKVEIQNTIGLAYAQMRDLRGQYDIEHLDLIYDTFTDVDQVLATRESLVLEINSIMNNASLLLQEYQE